MDRSEVEIDDVVVRLSRVPGAVVGYGPGHPEHPNTAIEAVVRSFLDDYPLLRRDSGYVDFIQKYAGARIERAEDAVAVNIFGFADVSLDMMETEGELVYDGFLEFAQGIYQEDPEKIATSYQYDFAFDVSGVREPGVYRAHSTMTISGRPFTWYRADFLSWLDELVERSGVYEPPASD
jgi:hypothetical protein